HCTSSASVIELQRKLDVSRRLGVAVDDSGCGLAHGGIRNCQVDAVKRIQEIGAELNPETLRYLEVFLQADVPVVISGSSQTTQLRRARTAAGRVGIVAGINPLETTALSSGSVPPAEDGVGAIAVRAQAARRGARLVGAVV